MKVYWLYLKDNLRGKLWDQGLLEDLLKDEEHIESNVCYHEEKAIVIIPARYYVDSVGWVNEQISCIDEVTLILTSDEESLFPVEELRHPNMKLWVMTPDFKHTYPEGTRFLGEGYPPHMKLPEEPPVKNLDYFFSGQITHERRQMLAKAQEVIEEFAENNQLHGEFNSTPGFTQGYEPAEYYEKMMRAKAVPCPAGPATPDSFRLFEALECGAVPIADSEAPSGVSNYWEGLFPDAPFPIFNDYDFVQSGLVEVRDQYPVLNNKCMAWWMRYKRDLKDELVGRHGKSGQDTVNKTITVLMPTSPIPSNPDTSIIEETVSTVRSQLPGSEIILMFDGVREEQEHMRDNYNEYIRRVLWLANHKWKNVYPIIFDEHTHQAGMTRVALEEVKSELVLFVEHDTPITPDREIQWGQLVANIFQGEANLIRLCHEELILPDYEHMMLGPVVDVNGVKMVATVQWSQRPHLASTAFYKGFIHRYFGANQRTMIEDTMHSVLHTAFNEDGVMGWNLWRVWIYHPDTDALGIKRSYHLDGRADESKFEETFV